MATAAAEPTVLTSHRGMAQLTREAIVAIHQIASADDATPHARAERNDDKVLQTARRTVGHLADGRCIGVVRERHGDAPRTVADELCQRHLALPRQVGRKLNAAIEVVPIRRAHADTLDLVPSASRSNHGL